MSAPETRRRFPRLKLSVLSRARLVLPGGQGLQLVSLSIGGFGIALENAPQVLKDLNRDQYVQAITQIGDASVEVRFRVAHRSPEVLGCSVIGGEDTFRAAVERYFQLELAALRMKRVAPEQLKPVSDGEPVWFFGANNCELYCVFRQGALVRFNGSYFANYFEFSSAGGVKLGRVVASAPIEELRYSASELIEWETTPRESSRSGALAFIRAIEELKASERAELEKALANS